MVTWNSDDLKSARRDAWGCFWDFDSKEQCVDRIQSRFSQVAVVFKLQWYQDVGRPSKGRVRAVFYARWIAEDEQTNKAKGGPPQLHFYIKTIASPTQNDNAYSSELHALPLPLCIVTGCRQSTHHNRSTKTGQRMGDASLLPPLGTPCCPDLTWPDRVALIPSFSLWSVSLVIKDTGAATEWASLLLHACMHAVGTCTHVQWYLIMALSSTQPTERDLTTYRKLVLGDCFFL